MLKAAYLGLGALALLAGDARATREPVLLAPLMPWNLHYGDNSCQLMRTFGDAADPTILLLERIAPDSPLTLMVSGGGLRARPGSGMAKAAFLPFADHVFDQGDVAETVSKRQPAILWSGVDFLPGFPELPPVTKPSDVPPRDLARIAAMRALESDTAAKVTGVEITEPRGRTVVLQTGSLGKAVTMMRDCAREQMASWGLDPDVQDKIVRSAVSKRALASYFSPSDYPNLALRRGQQSIISARLVVGADGKVTSCTPLTVFAAEGFGEVTCKNLARAEFEPARLADGTRVPTWVTARIRWQMP